MSSEKFDVVVVGAGVAGLSCAYTVGSLSDKKVLVLEQHDYPDYRCAGAIGSLAGGELLQQIPEHIVESRVEAARLRVAEEEAKVKAEGVVVDRKGLNEWLLERLRNLDNVTVLFRRKVTDCAETAKECRVSAFCDEKVELFETYRARKLVLACGCDLTQPEKYLAFAFQAFLETEDLDLQREILLDFTPKYSRFGYVWAFPARGYFKVGVGDRVKYMRNLGERLKA